MEHCIIKGERCSKCCEVLTVKNTKLFRDWKKYLRTHGFTDNEKNRDFEMTCSMTREISKRRVKKINPMLVKIVGNNQSYFTCKNYKGGVCTIYENRPYMCSGYPYYGRTKEEFLEQGDEALYTEDCTYYIDGDLK